MAQSSDQRVFFDHHDILQRVLFLYGHTDDSFFVSGTMYNSMEYMLECHLQKLGYDLVLFYNGVQQLYCYTQAMAEKRDQLFREQREAENQRSQQVADELSAFLGDEEAQPSAPAGEKAPLRLQIDDLQIATFADQVMRRQDIRSAIVFSDGWDLLENTRPDALRTLSNRFRSWYHLSASNRNIAILCFGALTQVHLTESIRHAPSWGFLQDKIIRGNAFTEAVKYISIPREDELEGRLRLERAYRELTLDERDQVVAGAQRRLYSMGNMLKGLDDYLNTEEDAVGKLARSLEDDGEALDILKNTRGWEAVVDTVERIARTVEASEKPEKPTAKAGTILRMTEGQPFSPAGICLNIVLKGNPGTGKTTIAKLLGRIFRKLGLLPSGHVVETARDDLVGRYIGHTAANTRAKIEEAMGGILFVDEAYSLYRQSDGPGSRDFGVEAIDTLIEAMTRSVGSFAVVLAGYPEEMEHMLNANPGFRSRFGQNIITIEDYQPDLLKKISMDYLASQYVKTGLSFDQELLQPGITGNRPLDVFFNGWFNARNRKHFGNARDCRNLVDVLTDRAVRRGAATITQEDFPPELRLFFKEADLDIGTVLASMDQIVGQAAVKEKLLSIVQRLRLRNRQAAARPGKGAKTIAPGHYLFCGNPGTGKSTIADKFAQVLGALRITGRFEPKRITGTMLYRAMQTQGVEGMRRMIEDARGGVLFIDEAHQLIGIPTALQLLLDPMIELRNELCVILACYERDVDRLFEAEPGLPSRLNGIFHFDDYTVEELVSIFEKKVEAAGYTMAEGVREATETWFAGRLMADAESHNGRYAEQLLTRIEERMAERLDTEDEEMSEDMLFEIAPEDVV